MTITEDQGQQGVSFGVADPEPESAVGACGRLQFFRQLQGAANIRRST
jgi:hypothetical protein